MSRLDPLWLIVPILLYKIGVILILHKYRDWFILHTSPPELGRLENKEQRRHAFGTMLQYFYRDRRNWISISIFAIGVGIAALGCVTTCALIAGGPWNNVGFAIALILVIVIPSLAQPISIVWHRKRMTKYLRKYLNEHGVPICMPCGYDLRGQVDPYCPECGTPFVRHSENA